MRTIGVAVIVVAWLVSRSCPRASGQSCSCGVTKSKEAQYDKLLELTAAEIRDADATHLPLGAAKQAPWCESRNGASPA